MISDINVSCIVTIKKFLYTNIITTNINTETKTANTNNTITDSTDLILKT